MRIKTQFGISMVLYGLTLSVFGVSVLMTSRQVARLETQEQIAVAIGRGASELDYLSNDYLLYGEEQQRSRWHTKWSVVSKELSRLSPATPEERAIADSIAADLARLRGVFADVTEMTGAASDELLQVSWSRMAVQHQGVAFHALRLSQVLTDEKAEVQRRNVMLIAALLAMFGAYYVTNYRIVIGRTLRSLADVQAGTEIVGRGNLDHTIPVVRNDEIGDLSRAFNSMTRDLKGVTASKSQLEEEIAEREAAEEALRESILQIEELSEAREQELAAVKKLLEAADAVSKWTEFDGLAQELAQILLKVTSHSRATVITWDERSREIETVASEGRTPHLAGSRWPIDQLSTSFRRAITEQRTQVWDLAELPEEERGIGAALFHVRYVLFAPLVQREKLVGMIVLDDPGERREFNDLEIALVEGIASQAAVALENARLFEAERHIADRLQEALLSLPESLPGIEFGHAYRSATETARVGGDFYDLFEIRDDLLGITIGDVAGKGLDAAVLTSLVKNTIRAHAYTKEADPSGILTLANDVVCKATPLEVFVTVFFGILDCRDGHLVYANAAHTTAAVVARNGSIREIPSTGPLLGAFPDIDFGQAEVSLGLDEMLFLYTDGLTEARRDGEQYGEEALFAFLGRTKDSAVREVVRCVIREVTSFSENRLRDDIAVLAMRRSAHEPLAPLIGEAAS